MAIPVQPVETVFATRLLFGRLKTEMFYLQDWQETTIDQFMGVIDTYIRWYNEKRIKMSLGALSPIEYRASLGLAA